MPKLASGKIRRGGGLIRRYGYGRYVKSACPSDSKEREGERETMLMSAVVCPNFRSCLHLDCVKWYHTTTAVATLECMFCFPFFHSHLLIVKVIRVQCAEGSIWCLLQLKDPGSNPAFRVLFFLNCSAEEYVVGVKTIKI